MITSTSTNPLIIIAPHCDDEVIGCYSKLIEDRPKMVFFLFEVDSFRRGEALKSSRAFQFTPIFPDTPEAGLRYLESMLEDNPRLKPEILIPSRLDNHHHHKLTNKMFFKYATGFYSVDMNASKPLPEESRNRKKLELDRCYPTQADLWHNDAKYYLFEEIRNKDWEEYFIFTPTHLPNWEIKVLSSQADVAVKVARNIKPMQTVEDFMADLMSACEGKITITMRIDHLIFRTLESN